jgi:hypothetical protein
VWRNQLAERDPHRGALETAKFLNRARSHGTGSGTEVANNERKFNIMKRTVAVFLIAIAYRAVLIFGRCVVRIVGPTSVFEGGSVRVWWGIAQHWRTFERKIEMCIPDFGLNSRNSV